MVTQQTGIAIHDQIDTFARVRTVPDNIAKAVNLVDLLRSDIFQNRLEALEITVNIADQCTLHGQRVLNTSLMQRTCFLSGGFSLVRSLGRNRRAPSIPQSF